MGFYSNVILPQILKSSMNNPEVMRLRGQYIPAATGRVLEIGLGSGLNLPFYAHDVSEISGVDPSAALLKAAGKSISDAPAGVRLINGSAEKLEFEDRAFDSVVTTWSLCSIADVEAALGEMRRVLKPGGKLIFIEHGRAPEAAVEKWQNWLTPLWKRIGGGCRLNRKMDMLIKEAGFSIETMKSGYMIKGPRPMTFHYAGTASPR